ncbi:hypothetical protein CMUS01_04318 [Colletotrichum musicola]|uniref:Uncharacterized protein n=1 Tax=Colletotrichum musicola TaxID=2175873 RepID=A0A8H6KX73_9PEZI|nr:hypothetical protein CMUS01_04318 [Colletotrichum musicola]
MNPDPAAWTDRRGAFGFATRKQSVPSRSFGTGSDGISKFLSYEQLLPPWMKELSGPAEQRRPPSVPKRGGCRPTPPVSFPGPRRQLARRQELVFATETSRHPNPSVDSLRLV